MIALNVLFLVLYFAVDWQVWVQFSGGLQGFRSDLAYEGVNVVQEYGIFARSLEINGHYRTAHSLEGFTFLGLSWNFPQVLFAVLIALNVILLGWMGRCQRKGSQ